MEESTKNKSLNSKQTNHSSYDSAQIKLERPHVKNDERDHYEARIEDKILYIEKISQKNNDLNDLGDKSMTQTGNEPLSDYNQKRITTELIARSEQEAIFIMNDSN